MIPIEAVELVPAARPSERWRMRLDVLLRALHSITIAEHPYAYLVATQPKPRA